MALAALASGDLKHWHVSGFTHCMVDGGALQLISPLFLPPPQQVLAKLLTIAGPQGFMDATLWQHLAASLTRIVLALLAAVVIGIPVGIAMGLSPTVRGILDPVIELYRPVPRWLICR